MKKTLTCILMLAALITMGSCGKEEKKDAADKAAATELSPVKVTGTKSTNSYDKEELEYVELEEGEYTISFAPIENDSEHFLATFSPKLNIKPAKKDSRCYVLSFHVLDKGEETIWGGSFNTNNRSQRLITEALQGDSPTVVEIELETKVSKKEYEDLKSNAKYINISSIGIEDLPSEASEETVASSSSTYSSAYSDYDDAYNKAAKEYQDAYDQAKKQYQDAYNEAKRQYGL